VLKKIKFLNIILLIISINFLLVTPVLAQTPTPTATPTASPTPSITSTPNPNATQSPNATVTPSPSPEYIIIGPDRIESINPKGNPLFFDSYNMTVIRLVYATCVNSTLDVSTSTNEWSETRDSVSITFYATGITTYLLHFEVTYDKVVNQSVLLSIQKGDGKTDYFPLNSFNMGFTLDVALNVAVTPHFPTEIEIWNYGWGQVQQMLDSMVKQNDAEQTNLWTLGFITTGILVVVLVIVLIFWRHQRHRDAQVNALVSRGLRGKA
jgi:hypothetical protein